MKSIFNYILFFVFTALSITILPVFALAAGTDIPVDSFLGQVLELIKIFGGLPWMGKVAGIILLLIASMKVSFLRPFWDKLGVWKSIAAPVLGILAGILTLGMSGQITLAGVVAYFFAGAGAVLISELLEAVKGIPGIGSAWLAVISFFEKLLGGAKPAPAPAAPTQQ